MRVEFEKLHGIGNDFVVIDGRSLAVSWAGTLGQTLCDRHKGIGADGLLIWRDTGAGPSMEVINADGSVAEMCGNGLRCFVKYLLDNHYPKLAAITVQTGAGPLSCEAQRDPSGRVQSVAVKMSAPQWQPEAIPLLAQGPLLDAPIQILAQSVRLTALNTGNPHGVTFDRVTEADRLRLGPALHDHPMFPAHANIEFARRVVDALGDVSFDLDVFERGCGWTQACGTGATATVLAAVRLGLAPAEKAIAVRLPGGTLHITVDRDGIATMRGPAVFVYCGQIEVQSSV